MNNITYSAVNFYFLFGITSGSLWGFNGDLNEICVTAGFCPQRSFLV